MKKAASKKVPKNLLKDEVVRVSLKERSYDVRIGSGAVTRIGKYLAGSPSKRAFLFSDESLHAHRETVIHSLEAAGWTVVECPLPAGEPLKEFDRLYPVYGKMLEAGIDRSSTLIALGGGSVGDAAGFVASTYLRGIRWVSLPTTLLAQVDSGIGGKTAVNHPEGKNLVGTFHQPCLVICDTDFLKTLSQREVVSGLGEVVKYGLTYDPKFFEFVRDSWSAAVSLDDQTLKKMVKTSVTWKAKAVSVDEFDRKGTREVLNFGHTFGHALEKVTKYEGFQHGEAVLWGMRFACALSKVRGKMSTKNWQRAEEFLSNIALPKLPKGIKPEQYFAPMKKDKKVHEGKVRFVLLKTIGQTVSDANVKEADLRSALELIGGANA